MRCMNCMGPLSGEETACPHCGYTLDHDSVDDQFLPPGTWLTRYELGRVLGAGGFGVTYLAWDNELERRVAIKEYFPSSLSTRIPGQSTITAFTGEKQQIFAHGLLRFVEEAQRLLQFAGYDGIVSAYDVFEANGTAYMVMEYVEGVTLKQSLSQFGRVEEKRLLDQMIPMLLTLKFVHQLGYIHRDIAPDNIMCLPDGTIKLLDFGSARYTVMEESQSLSVIVKQGFTPIEQYQSRGNQGPWTDIYAVGATMYLALTGSVPAGSLERLTDDTLPSPSQLGVEVSSSTEAAIMSALNVQPEDRPQDLDAFLAILTGSEEGYVVRRRRKRVSRVVAAAIALAALVGICGIAGAIWNWLHSEETTPTGDLYVPSIIGQYVDEADRILEEHELSLQIIGGAYYTAEMVDLGFVDADRIMTQEPGSGTAVEVNSTVDAEISKGKEQVYVPSVTDMMQETAEEQLELAGIQDPAQIEIVERESADYMAGSVISQNVAAGEGMDFDSTITLTVSTGAEETAQVPAEETFTVDDYSGRDFDETKEELLNHGIFIIKSAATYSLNIPFDEIISQSPAPGTEINTGEAVFVVVSLGVEQARVPDVRYLPVEDAKRELALHGLSWTVTYTADPYVAIDHVISQKITPGQQIPFGTAVELSVSQTEPLPPDIGPDDLSLQLSQKTMTLSVGESQALEWTCGKAGTILWSSSDPGIASVDQDGVVTANRFGSATIIAALDGNIAVCTITVEDALAAPSRFTYLIKIGETVAAAESLPKEWMAGAVWRSSVPEIASVDASGVITALAPGHCCVTASHGSVLFAFSITAEPAAEYIALSKASILGAREIAEQALREQQVEYTVHLERNDRAEEGIVLRIDYTGYMDDENYYVEEGTPVTIFVASRESTAEKYLTISKTKLINTRSSAEQALSDQGVDYTVRQEYSDSAAEERILRIDYTGYADQKNYYIRENTSVTLYVSVGKNSIESIRISKLPEKTTYLAGESPDYTGLTLIVTYRDGSTQTVESGFTAPTEALTSVPSQTVTVSYEGKSTALTFQVSSAKDLTIKSTPTKRQYYIGDTLDTAGLILSYTDENGQTQDVSSGFSAEADLDRAGSRTVTVAYQGMQVSFDVTVKRPSIQLTKQRQEEGLAIYVTTDPAGQPVEWSSSNENVLYFEGSRIVPAGPGTAVVTATMIYQGIEYSDDVTVTVGVQPEEQDYAFQIWREEYPDEWTGGLSRAEYGVESDIPGFDLKYVAWSIAAEDRGGWVTDMFTYMVDEYGMTNGESYTVTATYSYNGRTYSDSYTFLCQGQSSDEPQPEGPSYVFEIWREGYVDDMTGEPSRAEFGVKSDLPEFSLQNVGWSIMSETRGGWVNDNTFTYVVDEYGMVNGESYTVTATYSYNGEVYSDTYTHTYP